jgi:hypothetical protein
VADDVQLPEHAAALLTAAEEVTASWLRRVTRAAAVHGGADPTGWDDLDEVVDRTSTDLIAALQRLLATDVDEQRNNPLSLFRAATLAPTRLLREHEVPEPSGDRFSAEHFPDDPYRLGPASWSDIDERLHTPGLMWGAWKAMEVLRRRREEGQR